MWSREVLRTPGPNGKDSTDTSSTGDGRTIPSKRPETATLGRTVFVKGNLKGSEDLTIDGRVDGRVDLPDHVLTIGPNAVIQADIVARTIVAFGSIVGGVTAREVLEIRQSGSIVGQVACARLSIQEGAHFEGKVEMPARPVAADAHRAKPVPALA